MEWRESFRFLERHVTAQRNASRYDDTLKMLPNDEVKCVDTRIAGKVGSDLVPSNPHPHLPISSSRNETAGIFSNPSHYVE